MVQVVLTGGPATWGVNAPRNDYVSLRSGTPEVGAKLEVAVDFVPDEVLVAGYGPPWERAKYVRAGETIRLESYYNEGLPIYEYVGWVPAEDWDDLDKQ